jgi:hypothetical protein
MTPVTPVPSDPSALHGLGRPLLVFAGLPLLVAAPFEFLSVFDSRPFPEIAAGTAHAVSAHLVLLGFCGLLLAVPALVTHTGSTGRRLGRTAALLATAGAAGGVVSQWYIGTVLPWLAHSKSPELSGEMGGVGLYGTMALLMAGILALGISGLRSRVLPRPAAIMLIVAAVAAVFPPALVALTGAALLWSGAAGLRDPARSTSGTNVPVTT